MFEFNWPIYGLEEENAIQRVIRSNQLFAASEVKSFEVEYARYLNIDYALGLGNATQGLHLALAALGIGQGDEVIVTAFSWISTASCILMQNAVPIFCDIEENSFGMDPDCLINLINERTKAVIVVHPFGYPCQIERIKSICIEKQLMLIEDNSHAHGCTINGKKTGSFGDVSVASLHQRKSLPCGDGGILCTNNKAIYEKVFRLRSFGDTELSYNYRMTEFAAAIGRVRLQRLDQENNIRRQYAYKLADLFQQSSDFIRPLSVSDGIQPVFYAMLLKANNLPHLSNLQGYKSGPKSIFRYTWEPLHKHPHFNLDSVPARGYPWLSEEYKKSLVGKKSEWQIPTLPVAEKYLPCNLIEFYVHPTSTMSELEQAAHSLLSLC